MPRTGGEFDDAERSVVAAGRDGNAAARHRDQLAFAARVDRGEQTRAADAASLAVDDLAREHDSTLEAHVGNRVLALVGKIEPIEVARRETAGANGDPERAGLQRLEAIASFGI